ncbi:MAG TPA: EAL domain-containing protein [Gemmatimonadaceae bacterium]|nr:EAL domain-containing protein [Gemmatimonadaceae bacterium]
MNPAVLLTDGLDPVVIAAAALLPSWRSTVRGPDDILEAIDLLPDVRAVLLSTTDPTLLRAAVERSRLRHIPVLLACGDETARRRAVALRIEEWYTPPATPEEIASRVRSALSRMAVSGAELAERVEKVAYEEMLYDPLTGAAALPLMIERMRSLIRERGELAIFYLEFVRSGKIEEIYGWEKLDGVLETTMAAVREFFDSSAFHPVRTMTSFIHDDDIIVFHVPPREEGPAAAGNIVAGAARLQHQVRSRLQAVHGEDIAELFDMYVGHAQVYDTPKLRLERVIYRGVRDAANAARSVEQRERARRVADLKQVLHERSVYIDYHPILRADTGAIFGYEALARGVLRSLRSPEVMFDVAAEADLLWELGRLCRSRALEGMRGRLRGDQLLFVNADPHDFTDPAFELDSVDPQRVVIEITERTAITNYPKFREMLRTFRERGYRFAVDDAGRGYAGLGSIANLEPDFIKLDISLINSIDTNFIKQNLVETLVGFATEQGAMVIAEGIERPEELETVKRLGVPLVQGFLFNRPERTTHPGLADSPPEQPGAPGATDHAPDRPQRSREEPLDQRD